jgi:hypothetical protein
MSPAPAVAVLTRVIRIIRTFGPGALKALHTILLRAKGSDDPEAYLRRLAKAEAAHAGTQRIVKEALKATKK